MNRSIALIPMAVAALAVMGCEEKETPTPAGTGDTINSMADKAKETTDRVVDTAKDTVSQVKQQFLDGAKATVDSAEKTLDAAKDKISALPEMARGTADSAMKSARDQVTAARDKISELSSQSFDSQGAWDSAKSGLDSILTNLNNAVKSVTDAVGL